MPHIAKPNTPRCQHACRTCGEQCIFEPHPPNIMHKCPKDHADRFDPTLPSDTANVGFLEAEKSIYEMLSEEYPDVSEGERRTKAHECALQAMDLRIQELDTGEEIDIFCICAHAQKRHIGGVGRCKEDCDCDMFVPDKVKLDSVQ